MAENVICKSCKKFVHERQNAIFCDSCKTWLHLKRTGLPQSQFYNIGENNDAWFYKHCYCEIFPFHTLDKINFLILLLPSHMYQFSMTQTLITGLVTMHFAPYARGKISKLRRVYQVISADV